MASHIDNSALREAPTSVDLVNCLRQISTKVPTKQVIDHLLSAIQSEAIPPDAYVLYLSVVNSSDALVAALKQPFSKFIRYAAIKQFGRDLKKSNWKSMWDGVGGTKGLLRLLKESSVFEVDLLCKRTGWAALKPSDESSLRQQRVTELLQGLLPNHFPGSPYQSRDERPLHNHYASLLPACTSEFIKDLLIDCGGPFDLDRWPVRRVAQSHWPMLQKLVISTLSYQNSQAEAKPGSTERTNTEALDLFLPHLLREIPKAAGDRQGFSATMSFSLMVLRSVSQGADFCFDEKNFESLLVMPLIQRAVSKKADVRTMQEIFDLTLTYLEKHPQALTTAGSWHDKSFLAYVANSWSKQSRVFEKQLVAALKFQTLENPDELPEMDGIFRTVHRKDRYDLLCLIMFYANVWKVDINSDLDLRRLTIKQWPPSVFKSIPVIKARGLLLRLSKLKPEGDFLQVQSNFKQQSILAQPPSPGLNQGDPVLLNILLGSKGQTASEEVQKYVDRQKEQSFKSRDQATRAFYAVSAAFYAIASGSLDLYDQVMIWSRRYVRDPLSVKTIYETKSVNTIEGLTLLSGIPEDLSLQKSNDIRNSVVKANEILVNILETAILAFNEPSFFAGDWEGPKSLFRDVVAVRIIHSRRLKNALNLKNDDVYEILWKPTLEMLLKVERIGLQLGHEPLNFNSPNGPLSSRWSHQEMPSRLAFDGASYRFLDTLARARNDLWVQYHPTTHADCASLPKEWPRGLPIQALVGDFIYGIQDQAAKPCTPYISSRSAAVVFLAHNPVEKEDYFSEEIRAAIGEFVDRYDTALQIQVLQQKPGKEQGDQASAIVAHIVKLCCDDSSGTEGSESLSKYEAIQLCKSVFQRALRGLKIAAIDEAEEPYRTGYPLLPKDSFRLNPQEMFEWNPTEDKSQKVRTRQVSATLLDCIFEAQASISSKTSFKLPSAYRLITGYSSIWARRKILNLKHEGRAIEEGTVVSTLLFLESEIAKAPSILTLAFPSTQDIRYPPLFLHQGFLERNRNEKEMARQAISHLGYKVPSTLLQELSKNALDALSDLDLSPAETSSRNRTAYELLRLLLESDRPELATNSILTAIIDHPEETSWHRQLLKKSFLRTLSKSQAQKFLGSFVSSIHAKLDEQTRLRESRQADGQTNGVSSTTSKPIIKITTIKFLARILDDADVLSTKASVEILSDLLTKSSHVDVRVAIIGSMISKLECCRDDSTEELEDQIFEAFKKCIPIMASLNGRQILEQQDWKSAEETGNLPEVLGDGELNTVAPIFHELCSAPDHADLSTKQCTKLLQRVILPALSESQVNNSRWVALFAKKFDLESLHQGLPASPIHPQVPMSLIKSMSFPTPSWVLDLHHHHALIKLQPPGWMKAFNKKLRGDPEFCDSNAVRHWLFLYGKSPDLVTGAIGHLAFFLRKARMLSRAAHDPNLIQLSHMQKCLVEQASALLRLRDPDFTDWNRFISHFDPPTWVRDSTQDKAAWLVNSRTSLQQIIAMVEEIRMSSDWKHSPHKTETPFLPSTFPIRLLLLDYPDLYPKSSGEEKIGKFFNQLLELLREVQRLGLSHREKLSEISDAVNEVESEDKFLLACLFGKIQPFDDELIVDETELKTELAEKLLRNLSLDEEGKLTVTGLLKGWVRCQFEGVRLRGVRLGRWMDLEVEEKEEEE